MNPLSRLKTVPESLTPSRRRPIHGVVDLEEVIPAPWADKPGTYVQPGPEHGLQVNIKSGRDKDKTQLANTQPRLLFTCRKAPAIDPLDLLTKI